MQDRNKRLRCKFTCMSSLFMTGLYGESHTARSSEADSSCISQLSSRMRGESQTLRKSEAFSKWLGQKEQEK